MRTHEERIAAMHSRAAELNKAQRKRKVRIMQFAGSAVAFAATIMLAVFMPRISDFETNTNAWPTGSVFADSGALGYIVIAIIAFLLGVALTMFCIRLSEWQKRKDKEES